MTPTKLPRELAEWVEKAALKRYPPEHASDQLGYDRNKIMREMYVEICTELFAHLLEAPSEFDEKAEYAAREAALRAKLDDYEKYWQPGELERANIEARILRDKLHVEETLLRQEIAQLRAEIEYVNKNYISLFLHDQRMGQAEDEIAQLKTENEELKTTPPAWEKTNLEQGRTIVRIIAENEKLRAQLAEAREALEFYASKDNRSALLIDECEFKEKYFKREYIVDFFESDYAKDNGSRAEIALKKLEGGAE